MTKNATSRFGNCAGPRGRFGVRAAAGEEVKRNGYHNTQRARQRYVCQDGCCGHFDDLTGTVFEGHHQPLEVWVLCLYLMGLNLSNRQIAAELGLNKDDVQKMTEQLREGVEAKKGSLS